MIQWHGMPLAELEVRVVDSSEGSNGTCLVGLEKEKNLIIVTVIHCFLDKHTANIYSITKII